MQFQNNGNISLHLRDALAYIDSAAHIDHLELEAMLLPARNEGSAHAWYLLSLLKQHNIDKRRAQFNTLHAAVRGSPQAQYDLAFNSTAKRASDIGYWLHKSAEQDYPDALFALSVMYDQGLSSFTKDTNKAIQLQLKAAQFGQIDAQTHVAGAYYLHGKGVPKSIPTAIDLFTKVINTPFTAVSNAVKRVTRRKFRSRAKLINAAGVAVLGPALGGGLVFLEGGRPMCVVDVVGGFGGVFFDGMIVGMIAGQLGAVAGWGQNWGGECFDGVPA
jgi:hypothetical protein